MGGGAARLPIGEVARRSGLAASTLRYYEDRGLLTNAGRDGGKRVYDVDVFLRLATVDLLVQAGFSLAEIASLLNHEENWRAAARVKIAEVERHLEQALLARHLLEHVLHCPAEPVESCRTYQLLIATHGEALADNSPRTTIAAAADAAGLPKRTPR